VADMATSEALREKLQGTVPEGSFLCDKLTFIVPDDGFCFRRMLEMSLGGS